MYGNFYYLICLLPTCAVAIDRLLAFLLLEKFSTAVAIDRLLAFQMLLLEHISTTAVIDLLLEKFSTAVAIEPSTA